MTRKKKKTIRTAHPDFEIPDLKPLHTFHLFYIFIGFTILFLPIFQIDLILDHSLMPRIFALSLFLTLLSIVLFYPNPYSPPSFSVLKGNVIPILIAYWVITIITMGFSRIFAEGFFDLVRTGLLVGMVVSAAIILHNTTSWEFKLPLFIAIAALIALGIGTFQYVNDVVHNPDEILSDGRPTIYLVTGRMSHKNEFSNSLMLMLPFLLFGVFALKTIWKYICGIAVAGILIMIIILKTRAVWMGTLGGMYAVSLLCVLYYKQLEIKPLLRHILLTILVSIPLGIVFIRILGKPSDDFSLQGRLYSILDFQSHHNIFRLKVWKGTMEMIKDHFWIGVGPKMWNIEYMAYMKGEFRDLTQSVWGRPHNDFLWIFAEKGIAGIALFLSFFASIFVMIWRIITQTGEKNHRILSLLLGGGLISYLVISFFAFPIERVNNLVYIGLMSACVIAMHQRLDQNESKVFYSRLLLIPFVLVFGFSTYFGYRGIEQEKNLLLWELAMNHERYEEAIYFAEESYNPMMLLDVAGRSNHEMIALAQERLGQFDEAMKSLDKALELFPTKPRMLNQKTVLYYQQGNYEDALRYAEMAHEIIPYDKKLTFDLAAVHIQFNRYEKALELFNSIPEKEKYPDVMNGIRQMENILGLQ